MIKKDIEPFVTLKAQEVPKDFSPEYHAVGCVIQKKSMYLNVHRKKDSYWGWPSGMIQDQSQFSGKTTLDKETIKHIICNAIRETRQETSIYLDEKDVEFLGSAYIRVPKRNMRSESHDYIYHLCYTIVPKGTEALSEGREVLTCEWWSTKETLEKQYLLVPGQVLCFQLVEELLKKR